MMPDHPNDDDDRTVIRPAARALPADDGHSSVAPAAAGPARAAALDNGLPLGTRLGEFEITTELGEGGFGIVYLATDQIGRAHV